MSSGASACITSISRQMRSRSLNQASRVRSWGRDCFSTNAVVSVVTRSTWLETPPPSGSMRTGPSAIQPRLAEVLGGVVGGELEHTKSSLFTFS